MPKFIDLTGKRFGKWTALNNANEKQNQAILWICKCECGVTKKVIGKTLTGGYSQSCGCDKKRLQSLSGQKHGFARTRTYQSWSDMKQRCLNPKSTGFQNYGARGISVYDGWIDSFENFLEDMGECPNNMTIERINNDGNYGPGNCKWITKKEQLRNTRRNRMVEYKGKTLCLAGMAELYGIDHKLLRWRINKGWSVERAINEPRHLENSHSKH